MLQSRIYALLGVLSLLAAPLSAIAAVHKTGSAVPVLVALLGVCVGVAAVKSLRGPWQAVMLLAFTLAASVIAGRVGTSVLAEVFAHTTLCIVSALLTLGISFWTRELARQEAAAVDEQPLPDGNGKELLKTDPPL